MGITIDQFTASEKTRLWAARHGLTIYKVSCKSNRIGQYLELHFVTPQIAERHSALIAQLSAEIGLPVTYATEPKPAHMSDMLTSILPPSWNVSKSHSLMKDAGQFVIKAFGAAKIPHQEIEAARDKFAKMTGYTLVVREA